MQFAIFGFVVAMQPAGTADVHTPITQAWPLAQTLAHMPQLLASVLRFASHPSVSLLLLQSPKAPLQGPPAQLGVAMLFDEQTLPQPPQLVLSVLALIGQPTIAMLFVQLAKP